MFYKKNDSNTTTPDVFRPSKGSSKVVIGNGVVIDPAIFLKDNGMFCKYYSIIFFIIYLTSYKMIHEKTK